MGSGGAFGENSDNENNYQQINNGDNFQGIKILKLDEDFNNVEPQDCKKIC